MENNPNETFQKKYSHLEVSILSLSEVEKDNATKRIDSEFFKKEFLRIKQQLVKLKSLYLKELLSFNNRYSQPSYDEGSNLKVINSQYIRNDFIDYENAKTGYGKIVPRESILINSTGVGTLGRVNINQSEIDFSIDSHINVLIVKDKNFLNPYFLMVFLQTRYGQSQIEKYYSGSSGQIEIYPRDFENFLVPILPHSFQKEIENIIKDSHSKSQQSKSLYKEAENILYTELRLDPENPLKSILKYEPTPNVSIHSLKESFLKTGRLDSEYYQARYESLEKNIGKFQTIQLDKLINYPISSGSTPRSETNSYTESKKGIPFVRVVDLKNGRIEIQNLVYIKPEIHQKTLKRTQLQQGDVLLSIAGTIGRCAIYDHDFPANINQALSIIRFSETKGILRLYLVAFFNSQIGQLYLEKYSRQGVQTNLNLDEVSNLEIPIIDIKIQNQIAHHIQKSFDLRKEAKDLLQKAKEQVENAINEGGGDIIALVKLKLKLAQVQYRTAIWIMYEYLGIFDTKKPLSSPINTTIKTLKDSFFKTGRLDSEYYQAKYDLIEKRIKDYKNGYMELQEIDIKDRNFTLEDERHYNYIELSNINNNGNISNPTRDIGKNLPLRAKRLVKTGDILISSIEGCLSSCAFITEEFNNYVVSNGFYILKTPYINGETLLILFKSSLFQEYLRKFPTGTILTAISKDELQNILIPKIDPNIQTEIAQNIQKSFELRTQSKALLQEAKEKVELAISKGGGATRRQVINIYKVYLPRIKSHLKQSKYFYRLSEWLLLEELGLFESKKLSPNLNILIQKYSQSFLKTSRLDSEYYQAKYSKNEAIIKSKPYAKLGDLVEIQKSIEPGSDSYLDKGIPFIRVSNLSKFSITSTNIFLSKDNFSQEYLDTLLPKKDTILFSKDGSIGVAYCLKSDADFITSSALLHLSLKDKSIIYPEYLTLILNSITTQLQAQRDSGGSIINHWKPSEITKVLIPILDIEIQKKIETKIQKSFELKQKSKQLLEEARKKVESAIKNHSNQKD